MKWVLIRAVPIWISLGSIIFISGCSTLGNVVPKEGPTMEKTYDSMNVINSNSSSSSSSSSNLNPNLNLNFNKNKDKNDYSVIADSSVLRSVQNPVNHEFYKIPNPPLEMYIFPHLVGREGNIPIPGYTTVFNVYEQDHYEINGISGIQR